VKLPRLVALGCLALALATLGGCGLAVEASPQPIPTSEIPLALTVPPTAVLSTPVVHGSLRVAIYLIAPDGSQLVETYRYLRPPPSPQELLDALQAGPTPVESDQGIESAIPATANLIYGGLSNGDLTVQLDPSYQTLLPDQAPLYFAQIVWSLTSLPTVKNVFFESDGIAVLPEIGNGSLAADMGVDRADYNQLAPSPA
jgi:hypothetical protein